MKATYCKGKTAVSKRGNGSVTVCSNLISQRHGRISGTVLTSDAR